jgi:hypothetical protein
MDENFLVNSYLKRAYPVHKFQTKFKMLPHIFHTSMWFLAENTGQFTRYRKLCSVNK